MSTKSFLVEEKVLVVPKTICKTVSTLASIDRGCSLTKVLYATEHDQDHYNIHFALFTNANFEEGLEYLKHKAILTSTSGKIRVTGAGCFKYKNIIKKHLNLDIEFIDEMMSQLKGCRWLVENFPTSEICYPPAEFDKSELKIEMSETFKKMIENMKEELNQNQQKDDDLFPAIFCFIGSAGGVFSLYPNGDSSLVGGFSLGGKPFLGLGKLLVGTGDYDEILELASKGKRGNVDTQVKEVLDDDPNSPYGNFPPELPIFPFGKPVDHNLSLSEFNKEDLAHSLVSSFAINFFQTVAIACKANKIKNVYFGGNFFRHELPRTEIMRIMSLYGSESMMNVQFLKTGHTGAIGAFTCTPEDLTGFLDKMKAATIGSNNSTKENTNK